MGHLIFFILHSMAVFFGLWLLTFTIPLHIIYGAVRTKRDPAPNFRTHVRCSECRELVLKGASICKHCNCRLTPQK